MSSSPTLRLGIAGLGTVGMGVMRLLHGPSNTSDGGNNADLLTARTGCRLQVTAIASRNHGKDRGMDLSGFRWCSQTLDLATADDVDVVVETIGGEDGLPLVLVEKALENGKHVVTANKALLAKHGAHLAQLAQDKGVTLAFEAAVAGGIPAIKTVREGLAANRITRVYGILNGTCNYILSTMRETGRSFDDVLAEAQALGYAEAEPSLDVDGFDAAHKLALLSSLAFGTQIDFGALQIEGIRRVTAEDIQTVEELGYRIKLLGLARQLDDGSIEQYVRPVLIPKDRSIAMVEGVFNAVVAHGNYVDEFMAVGRGAGAGPTASAVVADVMDIARGMQVPTLGVPASQLVPSQSASPEDLVRAVYMNISVHNQPGVLARVAQVMSDYGVSISGCIQKNAELNVPVSLIVTTHPARFGDVLAAKTALDGLDCCTQPVHMMKIETLD